MAGIAAAGRGELDLQASIGGRDFQLSVLTAGAALRRLAVDGVDLVEPFPSGSEPVWSQGTVLVPWPNRIRDGVWAHGGVDHRLELSEPALGNAIHGLVRTLAHQVDELGERHVILSTVVENVSGYPYRLRTSVRYELFADGLHVTHTVENLGNEAAPVAIGVHPYFRIGDVPSEDLEFRTAASEHIVVDDRLNPIGVEKVAGEFDLRAWRRVGDIYLDDAFGGLAVTDGTVRHELRAPDGRVLIVWAEERFGYVQVFTTDQFPARSGLLTAIAVEPMTAPANAFNSGQGTEWVSPGRRWSVRWGVEFL